jgi:hypothetical protein
MNKILLIGVLTAFAMQEVGYWGIVEPLFRSWGQGQVLADLVIACVLACIWMFRDAPTRGLSAWPFVVVTLAAGSFGPLLYLLVREFKRAPAR